MEAAISGFIYDTQRQLQAKTDPVTDEQLLIDYCRTGNREFYAQLVYRYERELFGYLRRYLGNSEAAEDVFQIAFLAVHLKCDSFQEGRRFKPWLYTIATNAAIDARRTASRRSTVSLDALREQDHEDVGQLMNLLVSNEPDPVDVSITSERSQMVNELLKQLPELMYSTVQLVYYQGMRYSEAAVILDIPVGTVKSRMNAAITKLIDIWETSKSIDGIDG